MRAHIQILTIKKLDQSDVFWPGCLKMVINSHFRSFLEMK